MENSNGICYIVGAAECSLHVAPSSADMVIAADGGYDSLVRAGIVPTLIIGDMDSVSDVPNDVEIKKFKIEKDETDTHLSLVEGASRGYKDFVILGGVGGRSDHTFANICTLLYAKRSGLRARLVTDDEEFLVIENEKITLSRGKYCGVSVFALGGNAEGVTVKGAKYKAENITLTPDFPLGVSNSFTAEYVEIEVLSGALLIMLRK